MPKIIRNNLPAGALDRAFKEARRRRLLSRSSEIPEIGLLECTLREATDRFQAAYLKAQLERFRWNVSETAIFAEMERTALHRKLRTLGIERGKR